MPRLGDTSSQRKEEEEEEEENEEREGMENGCLDMSNLGDLWDILNHQFRSTILIVEPWAQHVWNQDNLYICNRTGPCNSC